MHNRRRRLVIAAGLSWAILVSALVFLAEPYGSYMNNDDWVNFWSWMFVPPLIFFFIFYIFSWATKEDVNDLKNEVTKNSIPNETPLSKTHNTKKTPEDLISSFISNNSSIFAKLHEKNCIGDDSLSIGSSFAWAIMILALKKNHKYGGDLKNISLNAINKAYKYNCRVWEKRTLASLFPPKLGLAPKNPDAFDKMHYSLHRSPEKISRLESAVDLTLKKVSANSKNNFSPIIEEIIFLRNQFVGEITDENDLKQSFSAACDKCLVSAENLVVQISSD